MAKVMSGMEFFNKTEAGKALLKVLPSQVSRVIIDIDVCKTVKIYCSSYETGEAFNLKWDDIVERMEIIKNDSDYNFIAAQDIKEGEPVFISNLDNRLHKINRPTKVSDESQA